MEFNDVIITILMFSVPLIAALLDKRKKKARQQGRRPLPHRPVFFPDEPGTDQVQDDMEGGTVFSGTVQRPAFKEGERTTSRKEQTKPPMPEEAPEQKEKIDAKKLIIYEAILNPKFKEDQV